jgi:DNA-binding NarL/FixJ family response regulator
MTLAAALAAPAVPDGGGRRGVRVLLLDEEEIVQWGFRVLLGGQLWAERCIGARDPETALELASRFEPHVVLVATGAVRGDPSAFCRELARVCCRRPSVLLPAAPGALAASTVRACGAAGFVSRDWPATDLVQAIRRASQGLTIQSPRPAVSSHLSARQQEILQLIADGATNREIALRLYLSRDTVKQHTSALYRKLGARNRTHAVQTARRQGLIPV